MFDTKLPITNDPSNLEQNALGLKLARERIRVALCKMHDDGSGRGLYLEADALERRDIEAAVEAFIKDDEVLQAIDRELAQAFDELASRAHRRH